MVHVRIEIIGIFIFRFLSFSPPLLSHIKGMRKSGNYKLRKTLHFCSSKLKIYMQISSFCKSFMILPLTLSAISRFHFAPHSLESVSNAGLSSCAMISRTVFIFICHSLRCELFVFYSRKLNFMAIRIIACVSVMFTMWNGA